MYRTLQIASSITVIRQLTQPYALWPRFMPCCSSKPAFWRSLIASGCSAWLLLSGRYSPFSFISSSRVGVRQLTKFHRRNNMPQTIDTVEDDSKISSILEDDASELVETRRVKSRFPVPTRKPRPRWVFAGLGLAFAAMAGFSWWLHARHFESTDDAQIDGHINVVSS